MVAFVSGNGLGLFNSSLAMLGTRGSAGDASTGRSGEQAYVNVASGNLIIQRQDELLVGQGLDAGLTRTYNSQGLLNDDNGDNWRMSVQKRVWKLTGTVNTAGSTVTRTDTDGAELVYTYNSTSGSYVNKDGVGAYDTLSYNSATSRWTWTDGSTRTVETYDWSGGAGKILSSTDVDGNTVTYGYTGSLLTLVTDASGEKTYLEYSGNNLMDLRTVRSDGSALTRTRYGYDAANRLQTVTVDLTPDDNSVTDGKTYVTTYTYVDATSRKIASISQSDGSATTFDYDSSGRVWHVYRNVSGTTQTTTITYGTNTTTVTDALGNATIFTYDAAGRLTNIAGPAVPGQPSLGLTYDANGSITRQTDGRGNTINYEYDSNGNQTLQEDAAGNTIRRTYGSRNEVLTETVYVTPDPDGYAGAGLATGPQTTNFVYSGTNHLRFTVSPEGRVTEYRYNTAGQQVAAIGYAGNAYTGTTFTETALANWVATTADKSRATRTDTAYDFRGQVDTITRFASVDGTSGIGVADGTQSVTQYVYDQAGELVKTITPKGVTGGKTTGITTYIHDGLGRTTIVTDTADGTSRQTITAYDDAHNTTTVTLANGLSTTSTYNGAGDLISVAQSSGGTALGTTRYWYDANDKLRMTQDATGAKSYLLYDAAGRKIAEIDGLGSATEYTYNGNNQLTSTRRYFSQMTAAALASLVDGAGNAANIAWSSIKPGSDPRDQVAWQVYDAANRLAKSVDANGYVTEYKYDGASRPITATRYANGVTVANIASATAATDPAVTPAVDAAHDRVSRTFYDNDGRVVGTLDGEGYLTENVYDSAGRLVSTIQYAKQTTSSDRASGTLALLRSEATISGADIRQWTLYDAQNRVIGQVDGEGYLTETAYDLNGNATSRTRYANRAQIAPASITSATKLDDLRPGSNVRDQTASWTWTDRNQMQTATNAEGTVTKYTYNNVGQLIQTDAAWNTADIRTQQTRYDVQGRVIAELSGEGSKALAALVSPTQAQIDAIWTQYGVSYTYDAAGRKTSAVDAVGNKTLYYYDVDDRLVYQINAAGEVLQNTYNSQGLVSSTTRYANRLSNLTGWAGGLVNTTVTQAISANANSANDATISYGYDLRGQATTITDELGNANQRTYNAFGETATRTTRIDSLTTTQTKYDYDRRGLDKTTTEDAGTGGLNRTSSVKYDAFGRLWQVVDGNNKTTTTGYDRLGRVVQVTDALTFGSSATYDAFGRVLTQTDRNNNTTTTSYDDVLRTVTITTQEGVKMTTGHDRLGQTISVVDGNGNTTTYAYDKDGHQTNRTNVGAGISESSYYDKAGRLWETTDGNNVKTVYRFDAAGRVLTRIVDPKASDGVNVDNPTGLNLSTTYLYDALGRTLSVTDPAGIVTRTVYDRKGQVKSIATDPTGINAVTSFTYDARGKTLTVIRGDGSTSPVTTQYVYDKLGRRTDEIIDPAGLKLKTSYAYDGNDNVVTRTDGNGKVTRYYYDADNQLVYTLDAQNGITALTYDNGGRVTQTRTYAKTLSGLSAVPTLSEISGKLANNANADPTDQITNTVYDRDNHVAYTVDALNQVTRYQVDGNGNVWRKTQYAKPLAAGTAVDKATLDTAMAGLASATDAIDYRVFDAANRAIWQVDGTGAATSFSYDKNGNVIAQRGYATRIANLSVLNAKNAAINPAASDATDAQVRMVYDAANRLSASAVAQLVDGGALKWAVTRQVVNGDGQVTSRTRYATLLSQQTLPASPTQADVANWVKTVAGGSQDQLQLFVYDAAGRQKYVIDGLGAVTRYSYDGVGNVNQTCAYATAIANVGALGDTPTVANIEASGVLTVDSTNDRNTYKTYDAANRLRYDVDANGYVTGYVYDAVGRIRTTTKYSTPYTTAPVPADGTGLAKSSNDQTDTLNYDAVGHLSSSVDAAGNTESYQYDGVGRKIRFTNKLGSVWDYQYDAAGNLRVEQGPPVSVSSVSVSNNADGSASPALSTTNAVRLETHLDYDACGRLTARTEAFGIAGQQRTTAYAYDAAGHQVTITYPNVAVYDAATDNVLVNGGANAGAVEKLVTPTVVVAFDAFGNAVVNKDVGGNYSYKAYDNAGQEKYAVDAMGYITQYDRDAFGNVTKLTRYAQKMSLASQGAKPLAMSDVTTFLSTNKSAADRVIQTQYDGAGRVIKVIEPQADTYDNMADASGNATGYGYVSAAKTTRTLYNAFGDALHVSVYGADATGKQVTVSADTYYRYNRLGQQVAQIDIKAHGVGGAAATGYLTAKTYDPTGNLKTVTEYAKEVAVNEGAYSATTGVPLPTALAADADNPDRTTTYQYDKLNRKTAEIRPNAVTTYYGYDAVGNQVFTTDAQGNTTYSYFDALGHVKAVATVPLQKQRTQLAQLYLALLGRAPDAAGFASNLSLLKQGTNLFTIAQALYNANTTFATASDGDFVNAVYNGLLGRNAEPAGASNWTSAITGMLRSGYSLAYARTQVVLNIANAVASGIQTDTVVMNDKVASALAFVDSGSNDAAAATANATSAGANANARIQVAQVYLAVLGRAATSDQLSNWAGQLAAGTTSLDVVAQQVYASADGQALYSHADDDIEIAARIYQNVYGKPPSNADLEYWAGNYRYLASQRMLPPTGAFGWFVANLLNTLTATGNIGSADWTQFQSRVAATLPEGVDTYASPATLSEFTLDAYGNAIQKVDRVAGAQYANATSFGTTAGNDRVTTTRYDNSGHAIEVIDGNGKASFASYDVYGHVAKQWQTVSDADGNARTAFKVFNYDAVGQLTDVIEPGALSAIGQKTQTWSSQLIASGSGTQNSTQPVMDTYSVTTTTTISYNGTILSTATATSQVQIPHGLAGPAGTSVQDVPVTLPAQLAGAVKHHTDINAFGETTSETVSSVVNGTETATTTTMAQSFDTAGHVWRSNAGDGVTKVMLYDIEGHETVDIRNVDGQPLDGISSAALANSTAGMVRTETHFDLLGNAIQQILPTHSGVSITDWSAPPPPPPSGSAAMGYWNLSVGAQTNTRQYLYTYPPTQQAVYGNLCTQSISWSSLAGLGSGDVVMEVTYSGDINGTTSSSQLQPSGSGDTGMTFTAMAKDGGSITITSIKVSKRDIRGNLQLLMQTGGTSGQTKLATFPTSSDPSLFPVLKVRPAGSTAAWTSVPVMNFSDKVALNVYQQLGSMLSGDVDFRLFYVQPGVDPDPDVTPANLAGTMVLPGSNSVQINTQSGGTLPAPPAGSGSIQAVTPVVNRTYDRWGNTRTVSDPRNGGWLTKYVYNANNQITQTQDALNNIVKYAYDQMGRRLSVTDARGAVNQMRYDAAGNLVEELHADGGVVQYRYDALGQKIFERSATGVITRYGYDRVGNLVRRDVATDLGVNLTTTSVQASGNPVLVTGTVRGGMSDTYTYDALGRRIKQQNAAGEVTRTYFDLRGNVIQTIDNSGATTTYLLDHLNRITARLDADYKKQTWTYSGLYLHTHTDLGGALVNYTYNYLGQLSTQYTQNRTGSNQNLAYNYDKSSGLLLSVDDTGDGKDEQLTEYAYDAAGNRTREKTSSVVTTSGGTPQTTAVAQDNLIIFDALNRVTDVNDRYFYQHTDYDANGNRTHVKTTTAGTVYLAETWNAFDNMNRETVVDGTRDANGNAVIGNANGRAVGQAVYYDNSGNRVFAMQYGTALSSAYNIGNGTRAWSQGAGYATETYGYDAAGRLTDVWRNGAEVSQRGYDAASRLVSSKLGAANGGNATLLSSLAGMRLNTDGKTYVFDAAGRVKQESDWGTDGGWKFDTTYTYDTFGTLQYYNVTQSANGTPITASYSYEYVYYDERKVKKITTSQPPQANVTFTPGTTTNTYDGNGYLVKVDSTTNGKSSSLTNDVGGRALVRNNATRSLIVNGEVLGSLDINGGVQGMNVDTFKASYSSLEDVAMGSSSVGTYTVQSGDTLQSIAKAFWGDADLWYVIADANGLTGVTAGQQLIIPARVGAATNNYQNVKPYDPATIIGDTTPEIAGVTVAPPANDNGCGTVGMILVIVVAVVVTIYTAGAASSAIASAGEAAAGTTAASAGSMGFAETMAAGTAALGGASGAAGFAGAVIGGAVGSIASQGVAMAMGMQDHFSWLNVAYSALGSGLTAGLGMAANGAQQGEMLAMLKDGSKGLAMRAALANAATQGVRIVNGKQKHFDWRQTAASAAGAWTGNEVTTKLGNFGGNDFAGQLTRSSLSGLAAGTVTGVLDKNAFNARQVATDAFGNALGNSMVVAANESNLKAKQEEARQAIGANPSKYFADKLVAAGVSAEDAASLAQAPELQDFGKIASAIMAPGQGGSFDDLPLDQQTAILRSAVKSGEMPSLYDRMREPVDDVADSEHPFGNVKRGEGDVAPVAVNGTRDVTGSFIATAANVLDRANAAVAYLVDKVGAGNAEAAVLGIQAAVGGIPRTALSYAGNYVLGGVRADLSEKLSGLIAENAFDVGSANPDRAKDIWTVSRVLGGFGVDAAFGTARNIVENALSSRGILNAVASSRARPSGRNEHTPEIGSNLNPGRVFWKNKTEFDGIKVYQRGDSFDPNVRTTWREGGKVVSGTNLDRMATGRAPIGTDGKPVNLHHMTQSNDSAIAEMTQTFHQQNSKVIHINPNTIPSGIDRPVFDAWKSRYWTDRALNYRE